VNGEVAWELGLDSRRDPSQRRWLPGEVDLRAFVGGRVDLTFEVLEGAWPGAPEPRPEGPPKLSAGFAGMRFE
jgi:hypothetical protein